MCTVCGAGAACDAQLAAEAAADRASRESQYEAAVAAFASANRGGGGGGVGASTPFPYTAAAFRDALSLVGSRVLRLSVGRLGTRRLLVPLLDMANHDARPSAIVTTAAAGGEASGEAASGGPPERSSFHLMRKARR